MLESWTLTLWGEMKANKSSPHEGLEEIPIISTPVVNIPKETIEPIFDLAFILIAFLIGGLCFMIYTFCGARIRRRSFRRLRVVLEKEEKEIDEENIALREFSEEGFDDLISENRGFNIEDPY